METLIGIGEAARRLGVSVKTMQRWDKAGKLKPAAITPTGRRLYAEAQLRALLVKSEDSVTNCNNA